MLTQFTLKLLALVFMLLDHTAKVLLPTGTLAPLVGMEQEMLIRSGMLILGRAAFPMFAWFAAEGCRRSSHLGKYCLRLLIFGIFSEMPFQLCFYGAADFGFQLGCHNVLFTILLSAAAIYISSVLEHRGFNSVAVQILTSGVAIALGWVLRTDYNAWGVALILGLYYAPRRLGQLGFAAAWVTVFQLLWHGWDGTRLVWLTAAGSIQLLYWLGGLFGVLLLAAYSGERGPKSKWLFYCFYPAHLALLFLLTRI